MSQKELDNINLKYASLQRKYELLEEKYHVVIQEINIMNRIFPFDEVMDDYQETKHYSQYMDCIRVLKIHGIQTSN